MSFYQPVAPAGASNDIQLNLNGGFGVISGFSWISGELQVPGDIKLNDGGTFTTTLQTVTPTAARTISFPDATGTIGLVAGSSGQLLYNASGANAGASTLTYDGSILTSSGRFINSYSATASSPAKAFTGTWYTTGTATTTKPQVVIEPTGTTSTGWSTSGTGLGVNAASGFAGNLLDLQVNGTSKAKIDTNGYYYVETGGSFRSYVGTVAYFYVGSSQIRVPDYGITFCNAANINGPEIQVLREAANTLAQRNAANAQTFRVYNTFTDASNYERGFLRWSSNVFEVGPEAAGTGAARPMRITAATLKLPNLPTYADNAAATTGGLVAGDVYKTSTGELRITV